MATDYPLKAKQMVEEYIKNGRMNHEDMEVYVVWFCYILGGWKALVSTEIADGKYYEVTHNVAKNETYLDEYVKQRNVKVSHELEKEYGHDHNPVQHRDGREPWCNACGLTADFENPTGFINQRKAK